VRTIVEYSICKIIFGSAACAGKSGTSKLDLAKRDGRRAFNYFIGRRPNGFSCHRNKPQGPAAKEFRG